MGYSKGLHSLCTFQSFYTFLGATQDIVCNLQAKAVAPNKKNRCK